MNNPGRPSGAATAGFYSRYTFTFHLRIAACEGFLAGVFLLNEFVARMTFGASDLAITLLFMIPMASFLAPFFWQPPYRRGRVFLWIGVPGRALLLLLLFAGGEWTFISLVVLATMVGYLLIPVESNIIKINYGQLKGAYFGRATTVSALVTVTVTLAAGWLLQRDESLYRLIYPAAGAVGVLSYLTWSRLRKRAFETGGPRYAPGEERWRVADAVALWRSHPEFRRFEIAFFLYGLGFMMLTIIVPLYLVDRIHITYSQAGVAKGLIFYAIMVFLSPLAGRIYDRVGPHRLAGAGFVVLGCFAGVMLVSTGMGLVYAGFALFGLAMTLINVVWNLGPAHLSEPGKERFTMSVHLAIVGIRAVIGYPLGVIVKNLVSYEAVFVLVLLLEAAAAAVMFAGSKRREGSVGTFGQVRQEQARKVIPP